MLTYDRWKVRLLLLYDKSSIEKLWEKLFQSSRLMLALLAHPNNF